jgi:hypothetical protein
VREWARAGVFLVGFFMKNSLFVHGFYISLLLATGGFFCQKIQKSREILQFSQNSTPDAMRLFEKFNQAILESIEKSATEYRNPSNDKFWKAAIKIDSISKLLLKSPVSDSKNYEIRLDSFQKTCLEIAENEPYLIETFNNSAIPKIKTTDFMRPILGEINELSLLNKKMAIFNFVERKINGTSFCCFGEIEPQISFEEPFVKIGETCKMEVIAMKYACISDYERTLKIEPSCKIRSANGYFKIKTLFKKEGLQPLKIQLTRKERFHSTPIISKKIFQIDVKQ